MTTYIYTFGAEFTKNKVKATPSSAPTIDIANLDAPTGALLVTAGATTELTNLTGFYVYQYSTTTPANYIANFHTSDTTVDLQDIPSFTSNVIIQNLDAAVSTRSSHTAADVWTSTTRTLSSYGTLIADIWGNAIRTLSAFAFTPTPSNVSDTTDIKAKIDANLDVAVSSRLANADYVAPDNVGIANAESASQSVDTKLTSLRASNLDNLDLQISLLPSTADVWNYVNRTLTEPITITSPIAPTEELVTIYNYTSNSISISSVPNEAEIYVTVKGNKSLGDDKSTIQISKLLGLIYVNNLPIASIPALSSSDASISVDVQGNLNIEITALASSYLDANRFLFGDIKTINVSDRVTLIKEFPVIIRDTVTHTI